MSGGPVGRQPRRKSGGRHGREWAPGPHRVERLMARERESMCAWCGERPVRPAIDGDACEPCYQAGSIFG